MTHTIPPAEDQACRHAARLLEEADSLVIAAGAGLGVDAGLPDFRGPQGFWRAYPALGRKGLSFTDIANPEAFQSLPRLAWGFYGHRLALYRRTEPHAGYHILRALAERAPDGAFVFTSNVDGHFLRAGFGTEQVIEVHGSIHRLQCLTPCTASLWPTDELLPNIDDARCEWQGTLPTCPRCGALARPNILMFGDANWIEHGTYMREERLVRLLTTRRRPVAIELGAGTTIPTVRAFCRSLQVPLIRINPQERTDAKHVAVDIRLGALAALRTITIHLATPLDGLDRPSDAALS